MACGILAPRPEMEPVPPALQWKHGVLTTGPPGKPQCWNVESCIFAEGDSGLGSLRDCHDTKFPLSE